MPPHKIYVEPFGGAGSVLLQKPRSYAEVYNDLWGVVVNVFRVLRDPMQARQLKQAIELTPFSRDEFRAVTPEVLQLALQNNPVEAARMTIFRSFAAFGTGGTDPQYNTGFRAQAHRSHTTPAHDWKNYPNRIKSFTERLRGVVIENKPALEVMRQQDHPEALHYLDPPYVPDTRTANNGGTSVYNKEMTTQDHIDLADGLKALEGMVMISGYPSDLYDKDLFKDWHRIEREAFADGAAKRTEVIWMNESCSQKVLETKKSLFDQNF